MLRVDVDLASYHGPPRPCENSDKATHGLGGPCYWQTRVKAQDFPYGYLATRNPLKTNEYSGTSELRYDGGAYRSL